MTTISILTKDGMVAAVGYNEVQSPAFPHPFGVVTNYDGRREGNPVAARNFNETFEAISQFHEAVATSVDRGWRVGYMGEQLNFPAFS